MSNGLMMFTYMSIGFTVACVSIDVTVVGSSSWNLLEERRVSDDSVILTRCSDHGTFLASNAMRVWVVCRRQFVPSRLLYQDGVSFCIRALFSMIAVVGISFHIFFDLV